MFCIMFVNNVKLCFVEELVRALTIMLALFNYLIFILSYCHPDVSHQSSWISLISLRKFNIRKVSSAESTKAV